eukprot:9142831-Pyramimonas_sp.AAC.1
MPRHLRPCNTERLSPRSYARVVPLAILRPPPLRLASRLFLASMPLNLFSLFGLADAPFAVRPTPGR